LCGFSSEGGRTSLHLAAVIGHVEVVQGLLNCGTIVDFANKEGQTSVQLAAENGHVEVV
jgi:ankyrin repeat protein